MRRTQSARRGNAVMEVAMITVPLFGLLFGIFDFGYAVFLRSCLQNAVREGVRYAVTYQTVSPSTCQDESIKQQVRWGGMGFLSAPANYDKIKVRYYDPATFTEILAPGGNAPGNVVEVSVENYQHRWLVPLYWPSTPIVMNIRSSDRMEGTPATGAPCR